MVLPDDEPASEEVSATPRAVNRAARQRAALLLAIGAAMTLCLRGYRFGESNHAVYLLAALRRADPALLANDWWTNATLQYHVVFTNLTALLMKLGVVEPAFLAGYLALTVLLHVGWRRLVVRLGGGDGTYLLSVFLYYLLAGGIGLWMYEFLQDSCFLPSNVAAVAMLWGVYELVAGREMRAGLWLGAAGLFHLNYAIAGIGLWAVMALLFVRERGLTQTLRSRAWWIGSAAVVSLSLPAILPALRTVVRRSGTMPLADFVDLYVRLRHPHHYDPSSWPVALWLTFLLPIPFAVVAWRTAARQGPRPELRRAAWVFAYSCALLVVALAGAGAWYVSESLVQMSLYRFSVFPKLISCIALGWLIWERGPGPRVVAWRLTLGAWAALLVLFVLVYYSQRPVPLPQAVRDNVATVWLFVALAAAGLAVARGGGGLQRARFVGTVLAGLVLYAVAFGHWDLGLKHPGLKGDDAAYRKAAAWAREHTPRDAVFLVPPDEQSWRLDARRAIVVNFKNVPQLSGELPEWRDRLQAVLGMDDLRDLPRPFYRTLEDIRARYHARPADALVSVARRYGARYLLATRPLDPATAGDPVYRDGQGRYFLYDLAQEPRTR
jgi:hypothetical protein